MSKEDFVYSIMPEFKKLGRDITNIETLGNRKLMYLKIYYRSNKNIRREIINKANKYKRLTYAGNTGIILSGREKYNYNVMYFVIGSEI